MEKFYQTVLKGVKEQCSDVHISGGYPAAYRKNGVLNFEQNGKWSPTEIDRLVENLLTAREKTMLQARLSVDLGRTIHGVRVRINVFTTIRGLSLAIRLLPGRPPNINELNLHPTLIEQCKLTSGLILVGGATGAGKTTTIAAIVEEINRSRTAHIITLEDPVEYRYIPVRSFVEQREFGMHFNSFEQGLQDVLREDPDVIVVGELREPEPMRLTLNAAEAGHLVIASVHAASVEDGIHRICNSFPPEAQEIVRNQLASTLSLFLVQKLIKQSRLNYRVPLLTILKGIPSVKGVIRDNRLHQLDSIMQTSKADGMFTEDQYLDFLNHEHVLKSPLENFVPSAQKQAELFYTSSLLDPARAGVGELRQPMAAEPAGSMRPEAANSFRPGAAMEETAGRRDPMGTTDSPDDPGMSSGSHYVIDDETPLSEVVAQMYDSPDQLDKLLRQAAAMESEDQGTSINLD